MDASVEAAPQPVRLRGRSYLAFVFTPVVPVVEWLKELDATIARSPGFFVGKPVVLDLSALELSRPAITHLLLSLEKKNIRILGIEGVDASLLTSAMPPLLTGGRTCAIAQVEPDKAEVKPPAASLLLERVRSGQAVVDVLQGCIEFPEPLTGLFELFVCAHGPVSTGAPGGEREPLRA